MSTANSFRRMACGSGRLGRFVRGALRKPRDDGRRGVLVIGVLAVARQRDAFGEARRANEEQSEKDSAGDRPLCYRAGGDRAECEDHPPLGLLEEKVRMARVLE